MTAQRRKASQGKARARKKPGKGPKSSRNKEKSAASGRATPRGNPRKTLFELPPLELECMKALWALGEANSGGEGITVREIREMVAATHRRLAYTTVETIMDRLTRKGYVTRQKKGRAHRYTAVYELVKARAEGVVMLLDHFFGGSRRALEAYLAGRPVIPARPRAATRPVPPPAPVRRKLPPRSVAPAETIDTSLL